MTKYFCDWCHKEQKYEELSCIRLPRRGKCPVFNEEIKYHYLCKDCKDKLISYIEKKEKEND